MYPRIDAETKKSSQRLEPIAKRFASIVLFIHAGAITFGRQFLAACHESQRVRAAAVIRKHQHLIDEARADATKQPLAGSSRPAHRSIVSEASPATRNRGSVPCLPY